MKSKEELYQMVTEGDYPTAFNALEDEKLNHEQQRVLNDLKREYIGGNIDHDFAPRLLVFVDSIKDMAQNPVSDTQKVIQQASPPSKMKLSTAAIVGICVGVILLYFLIFGGTSTPNEQNTGQKTEMNEQKEVNDQTGKSLKAYWAGTWECEINTCDTLPNQRNMITFEMQADNVKGHFKTELSAGVFSEGDMEGKINEKGDFLVGTWRQGNGDEGKFEFRIEEESTKVFIFKGKYTNIHRGNVWCEWYGKRKE